MNCPNCMAAMTSMTLDAHMAESVDIDVCMGCQAFWFDKFEPIRLTTASSLELIEMVRAQTSAGTAIEGDRLACPRCLARMPFVHDIQHNTKFSYWQCIEHGRFIGFLDFLREESFIRALTAKEISDLRDKIRMVNCSRCGAPIDLSSSSTCSHCGSPISIIDLKITK